nr:uncharacterized protein LOC115264890 [Aedes albopictus]
MFDDEALEVDFEVLLDRAGLTVYSSIIIDTHGITTAEEFSELQENDLDLFCRIARDRVMFRKLLANMKTLFNPEPAAVLKTETVNQLVETQSPQTPKTFKNFQEYLSSRPEGKGILAYYQEHKTLTNTLRNNMVKMIFTDAVAEGITLNSKFKEIMTKKITDLFTTENTVLLEYYQQQAIHANAKAVINEVRQRFRIPNFRAELITEGGDEALRVV